VRISGFNKLGESKAEEAGTRRLTMKQLLVQLGQLPKSKARGFVSFCDPPRPLKLRNTHWFATSELVTNNLLTIPSHNS
jgi:hypothetical protein